MYVYIYIYVFICFLFIYIYAFIFIFIFLYAYIDIHTYIRTDAYMYKEIYICMRGSTERRGEPAKAGWQSFSADSQAPGRLPGLALNP